MMNYFGFVLVRALAFYGITVASKPLPELPFFTNNYQKAIICYAIVIKIIRVHEIHWDLPLLAVDVIQTIKAQIRTKEKKSIHPAS
jgi:hypothetical protein